MDFQADPDASLRAAGAHEERFAPKLPKPPPRGTPFGRLRLLSIADAMQAPIRTYLLSGLIAPGELSLWWGAPKCGKSFLLLRLAYGLALGNGMWSRRAKPCRVLYIAAEGEGGFAARLLALRDAMGDAGDAFQYFAQRVTVGPPGADLSDAIAAALHMRATIVVVDTLARTFGDGDENQAQDMGGFVASLDRMREETGAHVAVVHHGTKTGETSRGSGALLGAADLIVKVSKGQDGEPNIASVEQAKDDVDGVPLPFRLRVVPLAPGEDDEPRSTCIADEAEAVGCGTSLPQSARDALRMLADLICAEGAPLPPGNLFPPGLQGVSMERWEAECDTRRLSMATIPASRQRAFHRAADKLRTAGRVAVRNDVVWISTRAAEPGKHE